MDLSAEFSTAEGVKGCKLWIEGRGREEGANAVESDPRGTRARFLRETIEHFLASWFIDRLLTKNYRWEKAFIHRMGVIGIADRRALISDIS